MNDSTTRFSNRVDDYVRYRPTYPAEIIDAIVEGFTSPIVADLGAGTGISAVILAQSGARVHAVEPNALMRGAIRHDERISVVDGTAEATTLPDASVDVVTAFQAYHWFDPAAVLEEAVRIGRTRVRFAAVWNHRDRNDELTAQYESIIDRYDVSRGGIDRNRRAGTVLDDLRRTGWTDVRTVEASHEHPLNWEAMIGFVRSASYLPREGDAYDAMAGELRAVYDRQAAAGNVRFRWTTRAYIGERYPAQ